MKLKYILVQILLCFAVVSLVPSCVEPVTPNEIVEDEGDDEEDKEEDKEERIWTIGLLCGITAYLITGIANDSSLVTAPGFWMLLGILAGIVCRQSGSDTVLKDKKHSR